MFGLMMQKQILKNALMKIQKGPELLAIACRKHGIKFLTFSSDLVFDG